MINFKLNNEHVTKFNQDGFIVVDNFLDINFLEKLQNKFEPLFKGDFETGIEPDEWNWKFGIDPDNVTRQICNAWKSDNLIKELVCHPVIGQSCSMLMNWSGSRLIQDNVLWKSSEGKSLGYHQDAAYVSWIITQTMITC